MDINNISLITNLKQKLNWGQKRLEYIAQNVSHADDPNYKSLDLEKFEIANTKNGPSRPLFGGFITNANHIAFQGVDNGKNSFAKNEAWEVKPSGNAVVLEEQLSKLSENQADYQATLRIYQRYSFLLKTAIRRPL